MKVSKKLFFVLLLIVLVSMQSLWAYTTTPLAIEIASNGSLTPDTYSDTAYTAVDGKVTDLGTAVSEIKTAEGGVNNSVYGIRPAQNKEISATSISDGITVVSTGSLKNAYGIYVDKSNSSVTINSISKIDVKSTRDSVGICTDTGVNSIYFKGDGGQAITVSGTQNATSIVADGQGTNTTVSFENCTLSGLITTSGNAILTLNFNQNAVWEPIPTIAGPVDVNLNTGSKIYTHSNTDDTECNMINLGTGNIIAQAGSKISLYAIVADNGLTVDYIKAGDSSLGSIALGEIFINDTTTTDWTSGKSAGVFVDANTQPLNNINITGTTCVYSNSTGRLFTFVGQSNGKIMATSKKISPISVTVGSSGYATIFFEDANMVVPDGVTVLDLTLNGTVFEKKHVYGKGTVLKAGKGYLITAEPGTYTFNYTSEKATEKFNSVLCGVLEETNVQDTDDAYVFSVVDGVPGFYKYIGKLGANKAFYQPTR